jgi:hypothetical protein
MLVTSGASGNGFKKALQAAPGLREDVLECWHFTENEEDDDPDLTDEDRAFLAEEMAKPCECADVLSGGRPDAFFVDTERRVVVVFEVDVTHALPPSKREWYGDLWFAFDASDEWFFYLVEVDKRGSATLPDTFAWGLRQDGEEAHVLCHAQGALAAVLSMHDEWLRFAIEAAELSKPKTSHHEDAHEARHPNPIKEEP